MKFRCERDVLVEALGTAGRAAARPGAAQAARSGVRVVLEGDRLQATGTDLDLTIQVEATVAGDGDGVAVIPARLAADIVRSLEPGAVTVEGAGAADDADEVRITAGRSNFSVRTLPADDFPRLAPPPAERVTLDAAELADALRQVVRAASTDDAVPVITGVLLAAEGDGVRLVATDRYRLAVRDLPGVQVFRDGQRVLIPSRALGEVQRLLSGAGTIEVGLGEREAVFEVGNTRVTTRLVEGEFPNYQQLIPSSYPNRLTVGREALLDAIRRVKLLVRDQHTPVRVTLRSDSIQLQAVDSEMGQAVEDVDAKYEGTEMTVAFNPTYLADGVDAVVGDEIVLETLDPMKPAVVRSLEGAAYLYLLMPVRVS